MEGKQEGFMIRKLVLFYFFIFSQIATAETVLVTGSNRGIGLQFVAQYAERDWKVIATSRSPEDDYDLQALADKYENILIEALDVTDQKEIDALAVKMKNQPIDLLINNAGLLGDRDKQVWGDIDRETFNQLMSVNVFGPLKVSEAFAENIFISERKQIVVLSSVIGSIGLRDTSTPLPSLAISKAAVNMAMRTVAMQLKDQGVIVAMLFPGSVQTRMMHQAFGMSIEEASKKKDFDYGFESLTPAESVNKMMTVIDSLDNFGTGVFLNNDGTEIPW